MTQGFWQVARAEVGREMRLPARWILLGAACGTGLASGSAIVAIADNSGASELVAGTGGTLPVQVSASAVAVVLAIGFLAATTGSTTDGTVTTSMILVPQHRRLLLARAVVPTVFGGGAALAVGLLVGAVHLLAGGGGVTVAVQQAVTAGISMTVVALLLLMVFLGATAMRRGAYAVAVFLLVVLVLPLLAAVMVLAGPPALVEIAQAMIDMTPGTLVLSALSVPSPGETWSTVARGLVGLVVWCLALLPVASWQFRREGSRSD